VTSVSFWKGGGETAMGQVTVKVNNRDYVVGCDDGEEAKIAGLSGLVDAKVKDLVGKLGQVGEARLLLMASLLVADDLALAFEQIDGLRAELSRAREQIAQVEADALALEALNERLESVAAALESA
jgi:cell division protein ZapA